MYEPAFNLPDLAHELRYGGFDNLVEVLGPDISPDLCVVGNDPTHGIEGACFVRGLLPDGDINIGIWAEISFADLHTIMDNWSHTEDLNPFDGFLANDLNQNRDPAEALPEIAVRVAYRAAGERPYFEILGEVDSHD